MSDVRRDTPSRSTDREIADWLLATLRLYGADEANAHRIVAYFLEALDAA